MIASARMYEWAPPLAAAWRRLLEWTAARAGVALEIVDSQRSVSLDDLWSRDDMGCVVMCGYPWALRQDRPALLAAPVPAPGRYGGRPVYVSDFIVRAESADRRLEDTFGGRIAFSTEHSHSGYNAARYHLLAYRSPDRPALYAEVKGPYVRQRAVINAVLEGEADVAAVDGYGLDLLRRHAPEVTARLRVVATTAPAPAPPLVASPTVDATARERLTQALTSCHEASEMKPVLEDLLLARFARIEPDAYQLILDWQRAAEAAGYPKLR